MTSRERVLAAIRRRPLDRVPLQDSPWQTTIARWRKEGLPEDQGPAEYFRYEFAGCSADLTLQLPTERVEETDEYVVDRNANGALVMNWKHRTSTPEMRDFTVTTRDKWNEVRDRYTYDDSRIDTGEGLRNNHAARDAGAFITYNAAIGYDKTQGIVGSENLLTAMAVDPDWAEEIFSMGVDLAIDCAKAMLRAGYHFDAGWAYDDNGYRNATLFSPAMYRKLLFPHHKRFCDFFHDMNRPVVLHSCGRVREFVPDYIEAGFDVLQPLEVKAGMDMLELKHNFGDRLTLMGGIDVRCMSDPDPRVIEREIASKIPPVKAGEGYIYHSDHSVPDDVSFAQYCRTIELVHQYGKYD